MTLRSAYGKLRTELSQSLGGPYIMVYVVCMMKVQHFKGMPEKA